jgi:translocation and assembly module TamA
MRINILILALLLLPVELYGLDISVRVTGLESKLKDNVLVYLSIEREKSRASLSEARLRLLHDKAESEIQQALKPFGFFKPRVDSTLEQKEKRFYATYSVQPGPAVKISEIDFQVIGEGREDQRVSKQFPLSVGDVLNLSDIPLYIGLQIRTKK